MSWLAPLVSWSPKINAKVFLAHDQFDAMTVAIARDKFIESNCQGLRRMVRIALPALTPPEL